MIANDSELREYTQDCVIMLAELLLREVCRMRYKVVVQSGNESGFVAYIPALKGCVSQGATRKAAMSNVKEAAVAYLECLIEDKLPIPPAQ